MRRATIWGWAICFGLVMLPATSTADVITWKAVGAGGAVAAGGINSVAAGVQILRDGGNAADAGAATILALAVTDYGNFAMGGEIPLLIYDAQWHAAALK